MRGISRRAGADGTCISRLAQSSRHGRRWNRFAIANRATHPPRVSPKCHSHKVSFFNPPTLRTGNMMVESSGNLTQCFVRHEKETRLKRAVRIPTQSCVGHSDATPTDATFTDATSTDATSTDAKKNAICAEVSKGLLHHLKGQINASTLKVCRIK